MKKVVCTLSLLGINPGLPRKWNITESKRMLKLKEKVRPKAMRFPIYHYVMVIFLGLILSASKVAFADNYGSCALPKASEAPYSREFGQVLQWNGEQWAGCTLLGGQVESGQSTHERPLYGCQNSRSTGKITLTRRYGQFGGKDNLRIHIEGAESCALVDIEGADLGGGVSSKKLHLNLDGTYSGSQVIYPGYGLFKVNIHDFNWTRFEEVWFVH
jgi:hypothetical protein